MRRRRLSGWASKRGRVRAGGVSVAPQKMRFAEFATSLFARKVETKEIRSAKGRQKWGNTLEHLIAGTEVIEMDDSGAQVGRKFVPGFGEMFLDKLGVVHIEEWRAGIARLIQAGDYAPTTCNSWRCRCCALSCRRRSASSGFPGSRRTA